MPENTQKGPKTLSVAAAGKLYFDLCPRSSYAAVRRGELPVIRIGRLLRVPVAAMEKMLAEAGQGVVAK
jgi:hypothetical protein